MCSPCTVNDILRAEYWRGLEMWFRVRSMSLTMAPFFKESTLVPSRLSLYCDHILYRLQNTVTHWSKIAIFHSPLYITHYGENGGEYIFALLSS